MVFFDPVGFRPLRRRDYEPIEVDGAEKEEFWVSKTDVECFRNGLIPTTAVYIRVNDSSTSQGITAYRTRDRSLVNKVTKAIGRTEEGRIRWEKTSKEALAVALFL